MKFKIGVMRNLYNQKYWRDDHKKIQFYNQQLIIPIKQRTKIC